MFGLSRPTGPSVTEINPAELNFAAGVRVRVF
jgi:hypothetical protein